MKKNELLKGVSDAYHTAISLREQLDSLTKSEFWDIHSQAERDKLVIILQNLKKYIADIVDVECKILYEGKNNKSE